jgi:DnaJ family protein C protein 27
VKVLSIGDSQVGKSCLVKRSCEGKFVSRYISTIGVDFGVRPLKINNIMTKVHFWDLAGDPAFLDIRNEFYDDTQALILVFDVCRAESFKNLELWLKEARKYCSGEFKPLVSVLCGNKIDLNKRRAVSAEVASAWAAKHGFKYYETSAKTGKNVNTMFLDTFKSILGKTKPH